MTAGEILKVLQENPEKEIVLKRWYRSDYNGFEFAHGYDTLQNLGRITSYEIHDLDNTIIFTIGNKSY